MTVWRSRYFYGQKLTDYELEQGYVSYGTLAKCFNLVQCGADILEDYDYEIVSGGVDEDRIYELKSRQEELEDIKESLEGNLLYVTGNKYLKLSGELSAVEDELVEINDELYNIYDTSDYQQYYIVDESAEDILKLNNENVFYIDKLGILVWGVTHIGTSWNLVLTNIKIEIEGD